MALDRKELRLDMREDASLRNDDMAQQFVQSESKFQRLHRQKDERHSLVVILDGQLKMLRHDAHFLVVARRVPRELEDLCGKVFEDGRKVYGSASTDAIRKVSFAQVAVNAADGELKTSLRRTSLVLRYVCISLASSSRFPFATHGCDG